MGCAGTAKQLEFNPFENPERAAWEEFGDVLAEGLFALFSDGLDVSWATKPFWRRFIESRAELIERIDSTLNDRAWTHEIVQAQASLASASKQLSGVGPDDCIAFVDAWRADRQSVREDVDRG